MHFLLITNIAIIFSGIVVLSQDMLLLTVALFPIRRFSFAFDRSKYYECYTLR